MFRGDLPGMYWDDDKKKYFKIQANHVAPEGAKYSRENVKKETEASRVSDWSFPEKRVFPCHLYNGSGYPHMQGNNTVFDSQLSQLTD